MDIKNPTGLGSGLRFWKERSSAHVEFFHTTTLPATTLTHLCRPFPHWKHVQMRGWSCKAYLASKAVSEWVNWCVVTNNKHMFLFCSHKYIYGGCSCEQFYVSKCECFSAVHSRQNPLSTHYFPMVITLSTKSLFRWILYSRFQLIGISWAYTGGIRLSKQFSYFYFCLEV